MNGAFDAGRFLEAGLFLFFLLLVFIGMGKTVLKVVQGRAPSEPLMEGPGEKPYKDGLLTTAPIVCLMLIVLALGVFIPQPLRDLVTEAAQFLENRP